MRLKRHAEIVAEIGHYVYWYVQYARAGSSSSRIFDALISLAAADIRDRPTGKAVAKEVAQ